MLQAVVYFFGLPMSGDRVFHTAYANGGAADLVSDVSADSGHSGGRWEPLGLRLIECDGLQRICATFCCGFAASF